MVVAIRTVATATRRELIVQFWSQRFCIHEYVVWCEKSPPLRDWPILPTSVTR